MIRGKLTVYFEDPFWVGVFERVENGRLSAAKFTFGAEPKDSDVLELVLRHYDELKFSVGVQCDLRQAADNPKRRQREAAKQVSCRGIGTKSQQALAAQREEMKCERKRRSKEQKEAEQQRRFELRQQKRKEKHRGH